MSTVFHTPRNSARSTVAIARAIAAPITVADGTPFGSTFPIIASVVRGGSVLAILEITARSGNVLTVSGAIEGTADAALVVGDLIEMRPTALAITELQAAIGTLEAIAAYSAQNKDAGSLVAGTPVTVHSSGTGIVAASAADSTRPAVGLLQSSVAVGFAGDVQATGLITLTDWTAITGSATLAARATYYLDTTAGKITATAPTTGGQVVQRIGSAVSPTTLDLQISRPILL